VLGIITLLLALAYYAAAAAIPPSMLADGVGPGGLPRIYAVALAALSLLLIARSGRPAAVHDEAASGAWRSAGIVLIGVAYLLVVPWLGYLPSIAGLIAATALYQGGVDRRRLAAVAAAGALFFWLLFVVVLGIDQPAGVWSSSR
jgi:hypothetical protein